MLAKLIKNDLKSTSRLIVPLYLILFFMSIINRFIINVNDASLVFRIIKVFLIFAYVLSIIAALAVTVFYMIIRFYKNLLMDEGYLMFTLPVKSHELITSKLLVTILWTIISIIGIFISLLIVFATPETLPAIRDIMKEAVADISREFGTSGILFFAEFITIILLGLVSNLLLIYVSMAVGQLFSKHKIIASFASYMIIYTAIQIIMIIGLVIFGDSMSENLNELSLVPQVVFPVIMVILAVTGTCFYLGTNYIFKRKLNLD